MAGREEFAARQREHEWFHGLRVPVGMWTILRVDGRGFSGHTERYYDKPYDPQFAAHVVTTTAALVEELGARLGYTQSDEISLVLPRSSALFGRSVEKLVSVGAGLASAAFTHASGRPAHFDGRLSISASIEEVVDNLSWRQSDATSSSLTNWCYWTLRREGLSAGEATARLQGVGTAAKNELLFQHGVNFNDVPAWQRRGTAVRWAARTSPSGGARRELVVERELPVRDEFRASVTRWIDE